MSSIDLKIHHALHNIKQRVTGIIFTDVTILIIKMQKTNADEAVHFRKLLPSRTFISENEKKFYAVWHLNKKGWSLENSSNNAPIDP